MPKYPKISLKKNKLVSENGVHRYTFSNDRKRLFFCSGGRFTRGYSGKFLLRITVCHVDLCQVTHRKCVWPGWAVSRCLCYSCCICAWLKTLAAAPFHHRFQGGVALVDQPLRFFQTFGRNSENFLASHWSRYPLVLQGSQVDVAILFTTHVEGLAVNTQLTWQRKWICERNDTMMSRS